MSKKGQTLSVCELLVALIELFNVWILLTVENPADFIAKDGPITFNLTGKNLNAKRIGNWTTFVSHILMSQVVLC